MSPCHSTFSNFNNIKTTYTKYKFNSWHTFPSGIKIFFILQHISNKDWVRVRTEQLKAQQVASQLEAALEELEEVARQLTPDDELQFERKIRPYKNQALDAVRVFKQNSDDSYKAFQPHISENDQKQQVMLLKEVLPVEIEIEQRKAQLETYVNLQKDIEELQDLFSEFSHQVHVSKIITLGIYWK